MSIVDRILNRFGYKAATPTPLYNQHGPYDFSYRPTFGHRHDSGINYKAEVGNLDTSSLVMAVVHWKATQLPEAQPVVQYPSGENNAYEIQWGHEVSALIRRPNPFTTWAEDCFLLALSLSIGGNFYWYKRRDTSGRLIELWLLPWFMVKERWPGDGGSPAVPTTGPNKAENDYLSHYQYNQPGRTPVLYKQSDIIHLKRGKDANNPRRGIGEFDSVIREIYGDNKAAAFTATILRNLGIIVPMLAPKGDGVTINETQALALKEKWVQQTTGDNVGLPVVAALPVEPVKFGYSPEELDLKELRKVPESRVAAVTGIPAALLQFLVGLENGTSYAAYREARQQGYESCIIPLQAMIAEQLTWQLLPELDQTAGARITFDVSGVRVLQEDRDALYGRMTRALASGGITVNQFLTSLNKPIVDGMDIHFVPSLATPMTTERLIEKANAEPQEAPEVNPIDAASLAKFADVEQWFAKLEDQMKGFVAHVR
jgi:phage portal protein BeeE